MTIKALAAEMVIYLTTLGVFPHWMTITMLKYGYRAVRFDHL